MLPPSRGCLVSQQQSAEPACQLAWLQAASPAAEKRRRQPSTPAAMQRQLPAWQHASAPVQLPACALARRCCRRLQRGARHVQAAGAQCNGVPPHSRQLWRGRLEPRGTVCPLCPALQPAHTLLCPAAAWRARGAFASGPQTPCCLLIPWPQQGGVLGKPLLGKPLLKTSGAVRPSCRSPTRQQCSGSRRSWRNWTARWSSCWN